MVFQASDDTVDEPMNMSFDDHDAGDLGGDDDDFNNDALSTHDQVYKDLLTLGPVS